MSFTIISTPADIDACFARHCNGFGDHPAKDVPDVRFDKLDSEQIQILNDFAKSNVGYAIFTPTIELLKHLLGLEPAGQEVPFITLGDVGYVATRNKYNRTRTMARIGAPKKEGSYVWSMVQGRWTLNTIDPWTIDVFGQAISLQHRATAMLIALQAGAILPPVIIAFGIPRQFKDLADKAKSRTKIDDSMTDPTQIPQELLDYLELATVGMARENKDLVKDRTLAVKLRSTLCGMLSQRMKGSDISATGAKQTFAAEDALVDRFGEVELPGVEYGDPNDLQYLEGGTFRSLDVLASKVIIKTRDVTGTILFSPAIIATALVLASNSETVIDAKAREEVANETNEEATASQFAENLVRKKQELVQGDLSIDWQLVDKFLDAFKASFIGIKKITDEVKSYGGPFGEAYAELVKFANLKKGLSADKKFVYSATSVPSMSAMVELVRRFKAGGEIEALGTSYTNENARTNYRNFGGIDIGAVPKATGKKKNDE